MADEICEVINEYIDASDSTRLDITPVFNEAASVITEAVTIALLSVLAATGDFSDAAQGNSAALVQEQGTLSESASHVGVFESTAADTADFSDALVVSRAELVEEEADFSDAASAAPPPATLAEEGALSDAALPATKMLVVVAEAADFAEAAGLMRSEVLAEEADASDAAIGTMLQGEEVSEEGDFSDAIAHIAHAGAVLAEVGDFADALAAAVSYTLTVNEEAVIEDMAYSGAAGGAWTMPTDTFAMSRWAGLPFNSIAEIDGKLYAASGDGLYRLDRAVADAGGIEVDASIRGGLTDFGDPSLKHASYYYLGYQSAGTMRVTVGYIPAGVEQSASYQMPARVANDPVPGRTKLGRGMRSLYWRVTLENVEGADFTIHAQSMLVDGSSRRI
jgi:hypothetical protein